MNAGFKMKLGSIFILTTAILILGFTQNIPKEKQKINWLSINDANAKFKSDPKPILIDLYTDWCYWCKVMDSRTYQNEKVIAYINEHFYPVKLNAESRDTILWNKQFYTYKPEYKINLFSLFATGGKLQFPSTIFLTEPSHPLSIAGYLRTGDIEVFLKYFGEGNDSKMSFPEFAGTFKNKW